MSKLAKVWAYLNKPVQEVAQDVVTVAKDAALGVLGVIGGGIAMLKSEVASAQTSPYITAAEQGLQKAGADAATVGGYVLTALLVVVAVMWVISMAKKK